MTEKEREYRNKIFDIYERNRTNLDLALLRTSSLGVPLTIAFNKSVITDPVCYPWLFWSFVVLWVLTALIVIGAMVLGDEILKRQLDRKGDPDLFWANAMNYAAITTFSLGVIAIGFFAALNL